MLKSLTVMPKVLLGAQGALVSGLDSSNIQGSPQVGLSVTIYGGSTVCQAL